MLSWYHPVLWNHIQAEPVVSQDIVSAVAGVSPSVPQYPELKVDLSACK